MKAPTLRHRGRGVGPHVCEQDKDDAATAIDTRVMNERERDGSELPSVRVIRQLKMAIVPFRGRIFLLYKSTDSIVI